MPLCRPVPTDFEEMATTMSHHALARHYRTSNRVVRRWFREINPRGRGASTAPAHNRRPLPADFAAVAPTLIKRQLRDRYRCTNETLERWLGEAGVSAKVYQPTARQRLNLVAMGQIALASTSKTIFDCAADTLRRERFHVHRCNERGGFDLKGQYWRVGYSILTGDELLIRAAKYDRSAA